MSVITVKLRFVGLYFNAPVEIDTEKYPSGITVKNVMDEYVHKHPITEPGGLAYSVKEDMYGPGTYSSLLSVAHNYVGKFDFNADGNIVEAPVGEIPDQDRPDGPTLIGEIRPAGLYQLTEFAIPTAPRGVVAWQYYVEGKDDVLKSRTPVSRGITRFDLTPDYGIADGDTIIWRMVAVLLAPSTTGKQPRGYANVTPGVVTEDPETYAPQ
ncbi:MAG: hypothetical protein H7145_00960 [Akkermansiaceae bacterium]|nr:hypothetical protein [Armatimonadota bacterium]